MEPVEAIHVEEPTHTIDVKLHRDDVKALLSTIHLDVGCVPAQYTHLTSVETNDEGHVVEWNWPEVEKWSTIHLWLLYKFAKRGWR